MHSLKLVFAGLAAVLICQACATQAEQTIPGTVTINAGTLAGTQGDGVLVFKNIPYAAPPVGGLRWKAPVQPAAWEGVRDASEYGAACPQPGRPDRPQSPALANQSEDCLNLNIWAPDNAENAPVMVWIHGGAHRIGSGTLPYYDGTAFAEKGVVLVTINYRLGLLGYFAHPALTAEATPDELIGNYGLMDQMAALEWVRDNIAAFGGDPDNVTVFGESAGAASTIYLLTTPAAHGLFAKAIVQSGGGFQQPDTLAEQEEKGRQYAEAAGLGANASAAELRGLSADQILEMAGPIRELGFGSFIDGRLVTEPPYAAFIAGREADVPLMIGANSNEASVMRTMGVNNRAVVAAAGGRLDELREVYDAATLGDEEFVRQVMGDFTFVAPAQWVAGETADGAPSYLYHFDYVMQRRRRQSPGASHAAEIPFVFKTLGDIPLLGRLVTDEDRAMAETVSDCWVSFAKTGTPDCGSGLTWPAYGQNNTLMLFDTDPGAETAYREPQMELVLELIETRLGLAGQ